MMTEAQILQQWIDDFVDVYGKNPSQETITVWKIRINLLYPDMLDEDE